jgi:N-acetylneuraminic acid mutarotase
MCRIKYAFILVFFLQIFILSCKKQDMQGRVPIAVSGDDQHIMFPVDSVILDGNGSSDPDGKIVEWVWTSLSGPAAVVVDRYKPKTVAKFAASGLYQFQLKVVDNGNNVGLDTIAVTVNGQYKSPLSPVANAGPDQVVYAENGGLTLDGSKTTDPDRNIESYAWKKISGPSNVTIYDFPPYATAHGLTPGIFLFELTVVDRENNFSNDTVQIDVRELSACGVISGRVIKNLSLVQVGVLSKRRPEVDAAAAGDLVLFAGGHEDYNYGSTRVDIYNTKTQTWSTAELSQRRSDMAAVSLGNQIFFAGGRWGDGAFDLLYSNVDVYNVVENKWTVHQLSEPRAYIGAAALGDEVLFVGGEKNTNYNTSDRVDIFNTKSGSWTTHTLSEPRAYIAGTTANNKAFFAGGQKDDRWYNQPSSAIDIYDPAQKSWSVSHLQRPMGMPSGITNGESIYWSDRCNAEIINVNTNVNKSAQLSRARPAFTNGTMNFIKNGLILFSNSTESGNLFFDILDPNSNTWYIGVLPQQISAYTVVSLNDNIYITGLDVTNLNSSIVWKLEF